jgi:hypothetical protein
MERKLMGLILTQTDKMAPYSVEVRNESFYISAPDGPHGIFVYPNKASDQGTAEILIADIPRIRACLDEIEKHLRETGEAPAGSFCCACGMALRGYHVAWLVDGGPLCRACDPLAPAL